MAAFHNSGGRRAPNVSQYIANLNAIPSAHELTTTTTTTSQHDHSTNSNTFIDDDLAIFTNTEFFDFDLGSEDIEHDGNTIISYDPSQEERARRENAAAAHKKSMAGMDFDNGM